MKRLYLGCGISKKSGFLGVDSLSLPGVDIVHDLNIYPYPFEENSVDEIWMDNVLEHILNPLRVMEEIFGGKIIGFFHRNLIKYAEKYPEKYESRWSHIFPLYSLTFYLKVIKS